MINYDEMILELSRVKYKGYYEYENYVAKVIENFERFKGATIERNIIRTGISQPGKYEIDIEVTIPLDLFEFKIIIECKNWKRPVGRDVVQKFHDTKKAINANKAAIVSPKGFTKEAFQLAKHHSIDLWVLNLKIFHISQHMLIQWPDSEDVEEKVNTLRTIRDYFFSSSSSRKISNGKSLEIGDDDFRLVDFKEKYCDIKFDPINLDLECTSDSHFDTGIDGMDLCLVNSKLALNLAKILIKETKKQI
jgi:hypothetical protein